MRVRSQAWCCKSFSTPQRASGAPTLGGHGQKRLWHDVYSSSSGSTSRRQRLTAAQQRLDSGMLSAAGVLALVALLCIGKT